MIYDIYDWSDWLSCYSHHQRVHGAPGAKLSTAEELFLQSAKMPRKAISEIKALVREVVVAWLRKRHPIDGFRAE